jgi:hypothetical protein
MTIIQNSLLAAPAPLSAAATGTAPRDSGTGSNAGVGACTCQPQESPELAGNVVELYPGASERTKRRRRLSRSEAGMATAEYANVRLS